MVMQMCWWLCTVACACGALVRAGAQRLSELRRPMRVASQPVCQRARASEVVGAHRAAGAAAIFRVHRNFYVGYTYSIAWVIVPDESPPLGLYDTVPVQLYGQLHVKCCAFEMFHCSEVVNEYVKVNPY